MAKKHHRRPASVSQPTTLAPVPLKPVNIEPVSMASSVTRHALNPQATPITAILLTVNQVCDLLGGISRSTLIRMEKTGKIPGRVKLGGSVRYHRPTVEEWCKTLISD